MNILILTGRFGMGHYSTAFSLKQEIQKQMDDANVEIIDIIDYITPKLKSVIYYGFNILVRKASRIYNFAYKNTTDSDFNIRIPFANIFVEKIESLIYHQKPDIIISTLPFCSRIVSEYKTKAGSNLPLVTCITDISIHNEWISPQTNLYLVATEKVKANLIKNGIKAENIVISGIPVNEKFRSINIDEDKYNKKTRNLLIMGGGLGLIPLGDSFYDKLNKVSNLKVTVIMGNNQKDYYRLLGKYENINVIGYTNKVYEYMAAADLIITKAGGITIFEAIHAQLPLLVLPPFLEQEKNNAYYIQEKNIGEILWGKSEDIVDRTINLVEDEKRLMTMQENMRSIKSNIDSNIILETIDKIKASEVA